LPDLYQAAEASADAGEWVEADRLLGAILARDPKFAPALDLFILVAWRRKAFGEALDRYRRIVATLAPLPTSGYDEEYESALLDTRNCPAPLRRRERFHSLIALFEATRSVAGDVAECGCFRGLSSRLMLGYLRKRDPGFTGLGFHIFDSFQGLSAPTLDDEIPDDWGGAEGLRSDCREGRFSATLEDVRRNLHDFPSVQFHAGWIPLTFQGLPERRHRFVHVDVDLYDPTLDCLHYFHPRLSPGGMIVCDDYNWPGARKALTEFSEDAGIPLTITPFNQAVLRAAGS